jgi:hypothetical protein
MLMTLNIILSTDADIGRGSRMRVRMRIKTLRMRILLCSSAQGSCYRMLKVRDITVEESRVIRSRRVCTELCAIGLGEYMLYNIM